MPNIMKSDVPSSCPNLRPAAAVQKPKLSFVMMMRSTVPVRANILMSIRDVHMENIAEGRKNHEYRKYLLPASVERIWFYTSAPVSAVQYVAQVGIGRQPGEVPEDGGMGNEDFNAGRKVSNYGYEIQKLWRLRNPITLATAREKGYLKGPPQKYNWAPTKLLQDYPLAGEDCVINRKRKRADTEKVVVEERLAKKVKTADAGDTGSANGREVLFA